MKSFFKIVTFSIVSVLSFFNVYSETVHIVKKGETLYSISRSYGISVKEIQNANGLADNNVKVNQKLMIPDENGSSSNIYAKQDNQIHIVKKGETLYSISRIYDVSVEEIQKWNNLSGNYVKVGQELVVSAVSDTKNSKVDTTEKSSKSNDIYYIVQKGDTWLGIALEHGLTLSEIQSINNISDTNMIRVGQKVKVSNVPDLKDNNPRVYTAKKVDASLVWPVKTSDVFYTTGKVNGVSLVAKKNETVRAISSGTVVKAGCYRGYGNIVLVQSKTGYVYAYTGLSNVHVSIGDFISYGGDVGTAGIDAYTDAPQVNLMVFQNSTPIDPAKAPRG